MDLPGIAQLAGIGSFLVSTINFIIANWGKLKIKSISTSTIITAVFLILGFAFSGVSFYFSYYSTSDKKYLESEKHLIPITEQTFRDERVILDGYSYRHCNFYNVTLVFNGKAMFELLDSNFYGGVVTSDNPRIAHVLKLLYEFHLLNPNVPFEEKKKGK